MEFRILLNYLNGFFPFKRVVWHKLVLYLIHLRINITSWITIINTLFLARYSSRLWNSRFCITIFRRVILHRSSFSLFESSANSRWLLNLLRKRQLDFIWIRVRYLFFIHYLFYFFQVVPNIHNLDIIRRKLYGGLKI